MKKQDIAKEAKKYQTRSEFQNNSPGVYKKASQLGILDQVCIHMKVLKKPAGHWTPENIKKEALKYQTRLEFHCKSSSAYAAGTRLKILDKVCSHMEKQCKWNKESIKKEALLYKSMKEFRIKNSGAYQKALKLMKEEPEVAAIIQNMKKKAKA